MNFFLRVLMENDRDHKTYISQKLRFIHKDKGKIAKILTITQLIISGVNRGGQRGRWEIFFGVFPAKTAAFIGICFEGVNAKATVVPLRYL
jgi:hypothetical protein